MGFDSSTQPQSGFLRLLDPDPDRAAVLGRHAQKVVLAQQGATARTIELIITAIEPEAARRRAA